MEHDDYYWAGIFPTAAQDDTVYWDCTIGVRPSQPSGKRPGEADNSWYWVVWYRQRRARSGWAMSERAAATIASSVVDVPLHRKEGVAIVDLEAVETEARRETGQHRLP